MGAWIRSIIVILAVGSVVVPIAGLGDSDHLCNAVKSNRAALSQTSMVDTFFECIGVSPNGSLYLALAIDRAWLPKKNFDVGVLIHDITAGKTHETTIRNFVDLEDMVGFYRDGIGFSSYWVTDQRIRVGYSVADPWTRFRTFTIDNGYRAIADTERVQHGANFIAKTKRFLIIKERVDLMTRISVLTRADGKTRADFRFINMWMGPEFEILEDAEQLVFRSRCSQTSGETTVDRIESLGSFRCRDATRNGENNGPMYIYTYDLKTEKVTVQEISE